MSEPELKKQKIDHQYDSQQTQKTVSANRITLGIMGHVDSGKSTLAGHFAYLTKQLSEHEYNKLVAQATRKNKVSFKFAFFTDRLEEQRQRGITIQPTLVEFKTRNKLYTIVDLPGHASLTKNFVNAITGIDVAVLLVSADDGIMPQTTEHARIAIANGAKRMIVVVNKMDKPGVDYSEARFNELRNKLEPVLSKHVQSLTFVPLSAIEGQNLITKSPNMAWYSGEPLMDILDAVPYRQIDTTKPFRMQISEVHNKTGIGLVIVGSVTQGVLRPKDNIFIKPSNKKGDVKSIEAFYKEQPMAKEGDSIGCVVRGLTKEDAKKGYIVSSVNDTPVNTIAMDVELNMVHPKITLKQASDVIVHYGCGNCAARIQKIYTIRNALGEVIADAQKGDLKGAGISKGQTAKVKLVPIKTLAMELARDNFKLGTFTVRNEQGTLAFASAVKLYPHPNENVPVTKLETIF